MPGRSPPESPYRYAHGPPPMTPSIPAMHLQHAPSSVPAQYMIHNREPPLLGRAVSQTTSPVSGGYAMLTPPAPYQPPASQQPHHLANRRPWTAHSYQSTQQQQQSQQPSPHSRALLPPSALPPAARHLEHSQHHRHTSQPQPLQGLNRHSVHLPLLPPSSHEQHQHQQHLFHPGSQPQPHDTHHLIPSPTTPTSKEQGTEAEQAHAPIVSPKKPQSPSLSLSLSSLSAASLRISGNSSSQTVREHPEHRRSRLADILNPIRRVVGHPISRDENAGARPESDSIKPLPPQVSSAQASGPLPSLGSILASVHTSTSCSDSGSIITTPKPEPSPPTSSQDSSEKWRPW
ncbi:hypothetical protein GGI12_006013 [Dipsacomyces acuminosporus]|nr:hypothetical protein GGI12_006013 [Dipsacomyces acuminosporus]